MTRHFMGALMVFVMVLSVVSVADMAVESDDDSLVAAERGGGAFRHREQPGPR